MKARVIKTGEIVEIKSHYPNYGEEYQDIYTQKLYNMDELDFNLDTPQKQSVTIEGWVARAEFGDLELYSECPDRLGIGSWYSQLGELTLPPDSFPNLKWSDEPLPATIQITEK